MGGACSTNNLNGKLEGKKPLGRLMPRLEDNIKMNLREIGWGAVD
jgi:hypothetical protein